jgi:hypothetical protein
MAEFRKHISSSMVLTFAAHAAGDIGEGRTADFLHVGCLVPEDTPDFSTGSGVRMHDEPDR